MSIDNTMYFPNKYFINRSVSLKKSNIQLNTRQVLALRAFKVSIYLLFGVDIKMID